MKTVYSYGDVSRLPTYSRDEKVWLYDRRDTAVVEIVRIESGVTKIVRRLYSWIEKEMAA
jgi:hypothetical protein